MKWGQGKFEEKKKNINTAIVINQNKEVNSHKWIPEQKVSLNRNWKMLGAKSWSE